MRHTRLLLLASLALPACSAEGGFEPGALGGGAADGYTQAAVVLGTLQFGDSIAVDHRPGFIDELPLNADDVETGELCEEPAETRRCAFSARWSTPVSQICRNGTWLNYHLNPQDCAACEAGNFQGCKQNPDAVNAGYEVYARSGSTIVAEIASEEAAVLVAYGPKRNDSWAEAEPLAFVHSDEAVLGFPVNEEGMYLLLVRREDTAKLPSKYELSVECQGNGCTQGPTYDVAFIFKNSPAEIHAEPSGDAEVIGQLQWDTTSVEGTGNQVGEGSTLWVELADGGWVNRRALVESVPLDHTCDMLGHPGSQESQLLAALEVGFAEQNGPLIGSVTSPIHGIGFALEQNAGAATVYDRYSVKNSFTSSKVQFWGFQDGNRINGTFAEMMLPKLQAGIQREIDLTCGASDAGKQWAAVYDGLNHVTYTTADTEWNVGIEYVDGTPYVTALTTSF